VVLSSDNSTGGVDAGGGGSNGPWRGNFFNIPFEGSTRTLAMVRWPGKAPAGVVTQEILAVHDWLPTLATLAGAADRVPKDRPIDGIDASAFMLGKKDTTGRDSFMAFGPDGGLMSVKWKIYKTIFRYSEGVDKGYVTPQFPLFYDLSSDPQENFNLFSTKLDMTWILSPVFQKVVGYERSVRQFPNIKPGEEFSGYPQK
jgi:arylsulfatase